jgi:two-component system, CitB family, sensor kinase
VASLLVGIVLFAHEERAQLDHQYEQRVLAIAKTVATAPEIQSAMEYGGSGDLIQNTAQRILEATHARYIVVIDTHGIRQSHPNPSPSR